ncbi:hypothetical protein [Acetobacter conturbans]|uniref:Uncharacterized protein n=1 Tax=Acetobacter conturbans TaxID=1737472 RepID=A0ABX0JZB9_9PROT|nr:hypothetical protein [Acetobacter conturbans]NHN88204.1 hypothetical protein [Acetobacter conturbans]
MNALDLSLMGSSELWVLAFVCHARLQTSWQRRRDWTPSPAMRRILQATRLVCPITGLILSWRLAHAEGVVVWLGSGSAAGIVVALMESWRETTKVRRLR